ncbi:glycosyltransferase family 4 protein [Capnocytophaga cynodegmi]|uniref:Glycosyltransferase family 1 protein n=1 Tax=Capnocytophaga cynodegmi TaxID=28189 RepID=A0A0B7HBF6_9FLAO|nr:conserved hypothetical protein [Capnocytophaga cynodegmi]CEN36603.1 conserved hypothetical protein [Capnocytophaga cynodegmi]
MKPKLFRVTTISGSLKLLKGQYRFMSDHGFEVIGISSKGRHLDDIRKDEEIRTIALEMTRTISLLKDLKSLFQFYKICKKERPLIVHTHTPKAGIVGMLGAKLAGVPIRLHTVAGLPLVESSGIKRKILDFVERLTYSCASRIYPNSKKMYEFIIKNNYTSKGKLKVIANGSSNGIDTQFFSPDRITEEKKSLLKRKLNISDSDFVLIFVGRIVGDKGINELVQAFVELNNPQMKLLLVGSQEKELDPLKKQTLIALEKNKNILSVGFQDDVRPYFAISKALVFPSYREGFPNVVMQAGAMEVPSIVSDINGCNEIIVSGENGIVIPVKNTEELKKSITTLFKNNVLYNKLKSNCRRMIVNRYEQKIIWSSLLREYQNLLKQHSKE